MLPLEWGAGFLPGSFQCRPRANLHIQAVRVSTVPGRGQAVRGEVSTGLLEFAHDQVYDLRVDHRVIRGDAHDNAGLKGAGSLVEAVQDIQHLTPIE